MLHTQPCKLNCVARLYTNWQNLTPCTAPFTEICFVMIIVLSEWNPLPNVLACSHETFIPLRCFRVLHPLYATTVGVHCHNRYKDKILRSRQDRTLRCNPDISSRSVRGQSEV